ncbi:MAG TPA: pyruvate kinase, partial [Candidatus Eisenbacteria bacterium]|nr:pyruvate kinase [Candidatus Eisenbacteria bacterium]
MPRTKIICTLGPASATQDTLKRLIDAGMDVARLNCSHGSHAAHARRILDVRRAAASRGRRVRVLLDLAGYRIRVGRFATSGGIDLRRRQTVHLVNRDVTGHERLIPFDYHGLLDDIPVGSRVFIDDGNIALTVIGKGAGYLKAQVLTPGLLKEHKGINIPGARLRFEGFTEKDEKDLAFGLAHGVDDVAQSFVRDARDIEAVRSRLGRSRCRVIAKIENHEGICNIDGILAVSDGIMVARGDLGVELNPEEVPPLQKRIVEAARRQGKPVIVATQMLESMIEAP